MSLRFFDFLGMDTLLRRHLWIVDGAAVILVALLAAHGTSAVIDGALTRRLRGAPPAREAKRAPAIGPPLDATLVIERNIFCSSCRPAPPAGDAAVEKGGPTPTALPLRLMAIMFPEREGDRRWAIAVVRDTATGFSGPYATGDRLHGAIVQAIEPTRVLLDHEGRTETLELVGPTAGEPSAATPRSPGGPLSAAVVAPVSARPTIPGGTSQLFNLRRDRISRRGTAPPGRVVPTGSP